MKKLIIIAMLVSTNNSCTKIANNLTLLNKNIDELINDFLVIETLIW